MAKMKRLFVDMDGVLAKFNPDASIEELNEPGYFENLETVDSVVKAIEDLAIADNDIEVCILSSVFNNGYAKQEKDRWLDKHLPMIKKRVFCTYGENKSNAVNLQEGDFLLDDFSKNLHEWEGIGIKLYNGINGNHGTWKGFAVSSNMEWKILSVSLQAIIHAA